jgi:hypothetical protein
MDEIERGVEAQIRKAMAEGKFDNLRGKGQPLNLDAYFQTPEDLRMGYAVLKNAAIVPEEVQLLKDIEALKEQRAAASDEEQKRQLSRAINDKTLSYHLLMDKRRRSRRA